MYFGIPEDGVLALKHTGILYVVIFYSFRVHLFVIVIFRAVPLHAWTGPEGSRHTMVVGCQPYAPVAFTPRK